MFYLIFLVAIVFMWGLIVVLSFIPRPREHRVEQGLNEQTEVHPLPMKVKYFLNSNQ